MRHIVKSHIKNSNVVFLGVILLTRRKLEFECDASLVRERCQISGHEPVVSVRRGLPGTKRVLGQVDIAVTDILCHLFA